ncbi:MAG: DUF1178 family protein [Burkholderiales bacterium]
MIVFDLRCAQGHTFEGWFASGEEFGRQQEGGLVRCPVCDDAHIERRPSAKVRVRKGSAKAEVTSAPAAAPAENVAGFPPELIAKLREIVRNTEDVGERFPEEARKIHYDEAEKRAIRGKASREEAEALLEEGIEFAPLPPILTGETH